MSTNVMVVVRVRPMPTSDLGEGAGCVVSMEGKQCAINKGKLGAKQFTFDRCFWSTDKGPGGGSFATQETVFEEIGKPVLDNAWGGYNCSVFAYGQTGSGKTYTMLGGEEGGSGGTGGGACAEEDDGAIAGLIPRTCHELFARIAQQTLHPDDDGGGGGGGGGRASRRPSLAQSVSRTFKVVASYMEIYNETVLDLLDGSADQQAEQRRRGKLVEAPPRKVLRVREHPRKGPYVEGLSSFEVGSYEDVQELLHRGEQRRSVGATKMNARSSRSHSIFVLEFTQTRLESATMSAVDRASKISLVDLAGSEKQSKSGSQGSRLREASNINRSLSALGHVISELVKQAERAEKTAAAAAGRDSPPAAGDGGGVLSRRRAGSMPEPRRRAGSVGRSTPTDDDKDHIPYRNSLLTWILKESLGGNARTTMVANISPSALQVEETLSTLRFAASAKRIKTHAKVNEDANVTLIRELRNEIELLKAKLAAPPVQISGRKTIGGASASIAAGGGDEDEADDVEDLALHHVQDAMLKAMHERQHRASAVLQSSSLESGGGGNGDAPPPPPPPPPMDAEQLALLRAMEVLHREREVDEAAGAAAEAGFSQLDHFGVELAKRRHSMDPDNPAAAVELEIAMAAQAAASNRARGYSGGGTVPDGAMAEAAAALAAVEVEETAAKAAAEVRKAAADLQKASAEALAEAEKQKKLTVEMEKMQKQLLAERAAHAATRRRAEREQEEAVGEAESELRRALATFEAEKEAELARVRAEAEDTRRNAEEQVRRAAAKAAADALAPSSSDEEDPEDVHRQHAAAKAAAAKAAAEAEAKAAAEQEKAAAQKDGAWWLPQRDEAGRLYFYHSETQEAVWDLPDDARVWGEGEGDAEWPGREVAAVVDLDDLRGVDSESSEGGEDPVDAQGMSFAAVTIDTPPAAAASGHAAAAPWSESADDFRYPRQASGAATGAEGRVSTPPGSPPPPDFSPPPSPPRESPSPAPAPAPQSADQWLQLSNARAAAKAEADARAKAELELASHRAALEEARSAASAATALAERERERARRAGEEARAAEALARQQAAAMAANALKRQQEEHAREHEEEHRRREAAQRAEAARISAAAAEAEARAAAAAAAAQRAAAAVTSGEAALQSSARRQRMERVRKLRAVRGSFRAAETGSEPAAASAAAAAAPPSRIPPVPAPPMNDAPPPPPPPPPPSDGRSLERRPTRSELAATEVKAARAKLAEAQSRREAAAKKLRAEQGDGFDSGLEGVVQVLEAGKFMKTWRTRFARLDGSGASGGKPGVWTFALFRQAAAGQDGQDKAQREAVGRALEMGATYAPPPAQFDPAPVVVLELTGARVGVTGSGGDDGDEVGWRELQLIPVGQPKGVKLRVRGTTRRQSWLEAMNHAATAPVPAGQMGGDSGTPITRGGDAAILATVAVHVNSSSGTAGADAVVAAATAAKQRRGSLQGMLARSANLNQSARDLRQLRASRSVREASNSSIGSDDSVASAPVGTVSTPTKSHEIAFSLTGRPSRAPMARAPLAPPPAAAPPLPPPEQEPATIAASAPDRTVQMRRRLSGKGAELLSVVTGGPSAIGGSAAAAATAAAAPPQFDGGPPPSRLPVMGAAALAPRPGSPLSPAAGGSLGPKRPAAASRRQSMETSERLRRLEAAREANRRLRQQAEAQGGT